MPSDTLFLPIFVPSHVREAVSDRAWLQAMLDAERALAAAGAQAGLVPAGAAETIAACCEAARFDVAQLADEGRQAANPVEPLVRALVAEAGDDAGRYVHWGATSQDVLDTAAMLVARRALEPIVEDLDGVAAGCAALATTHRSTPMAGRTLLQQAVPTTFGLVAAGWLVAVVETRRRLATIRAERLAAQLGGAAGTLSALGDRGLAVARLFAEELGLPEPVLAWHTNRVRVAELGGALDVTAGALGKIALDVMLLAQTEVGEVAEGGAGGGSSTMPHKVNPVDSTRASACARTVHGHASVLTAGLAQEHQRAAGAWQAEWLALSGALAFTGGAAAAIRQALERLEVFPERMRRNLELTNGLVLAERFAYLLASHVGRPEALRLVGEAARRAASSGRPLAAELAGDDSVAAHVDASELDAASDPAGYLGSAEELVDRSLELYRQERA